MKFKLPPIIALVTFFLVSGGRTIPLGKIRVIDVFEFPGQFTSKNYFSKRRWQIWIEHKTSNWGKRCPRKSVNEINQNIFLNTDFANKSRPI